MSSAQPMVDDFVAEYRRYRLLGERALAQLPDAALNRVPAPDANSAAMIVRHLSGNFASRFTDFLTTDGEKPSRDRDAEFAERTYPRAEVDAMWRDGWAAVEGAVAALDDTHLAHTVTIRGQPLSVHAALARSLAHAAYHVGQLVLLARTWADAPWQWLSIPKGASEAYNAAPSHERPSAPAHPSSAPASHPMPTTHADAQARGAAWARAWNARDLDAVLAHFAEDVTFLSPIAADLLGTPELRGARALRAYWEQALGRIRHLHFAVERVLWDAEARELAVMYVAELDARRVRACERLRLNAAGEVVFAEALYGAPATAGTAA